MAVFLEDLLRCVLPPLGLAIRDELTIRGAKQIALRYRRSYTLEISAATMAESSGSFERLRFVVGDRAGGRSRISWCW